MINSGEKYDASHATGFRLNPVPIPRSRSEPDLIMILCVLSSREKINAKAEDTACR